MGLLIGISLGLLSGVVGGKLDTMLMAVVDVSLSLPFTLVALPDTQNYTSGQWGGTPEMFVGQTRWIVDNNWDRVPMGPYNTLAFVGTALLFASEHGPFWDVGLLCGLVYNWYMWKTKSLGDLVLVHVTSNAALSAMVLITNRYSFWM